MPVNRKDHDALRQELGIGNIQSIWSVWSIQSIRSIPSYEDPILDLPLPWRERIEVRGSFVYLVYLVCLVCSVDFVCFVFSVIASHGPRLWTGLSMEETS